MQDAGAKSASLREPASRPLCPEGDRNTPRRSVHSARGMMVSAMCVVLSEAGAVSLKINLLTEGLWSLLLVSCKSFP